MVSVEEYGYDKGRFVNLTDEMFDCIICSEVVKKPQECLSCGSLFCEPCITSWFKKTKECPNRCTPTSGGIQPISKALGRIYNQLDIKCAHYDKCNQIVKLIDLERHEKICQLPRCVNYELCEKTLPEGSKPDDTCSFECMIFMKIKAANGDYSIMHRELSQHLKSFGPNNLNKSLSISSNNQTSSNSNIDAVVAFKWDPTHCGTNIVLKENNTHAYLNENPYLFKSVLGDFGFTKGIHYWELHMDKRTENELKVGVSTRNNFDMNSAFCDFEFGYSYYGMGQLRHKSNSSGIVYGKKFKKEGVVGICLNMEKGTLSFSLNGESFGPAYTDVALTKGPIYPAIALLHNAGCKLVSGLPVPSYFKN